MPRFPVGFGRRKSTADNFENGQVAESSFRVLERTEVANGKSFDGGARLAAKSQLPKTTLSDVSHLDDNIFADLKPNRGSGASHTTKATSDNSSRHSNVSTAPSSADAGGNSEEWKGGPKKPAYDHIPIPAIPKSTSGFLKSAGRSWSFGGKNKHTTAAPLTEEPLPISTPPEQSSKGDSNTRSRAATTSTVSTATPPKVDQDFDLDLGGDFSRILLGYDKRSSVATIKEESGPRSVLAPRPLTTGSRLNQPPPIHVDSSVKVEQSPYSWGSHHSGDQLLTRSPIALSPTNENAPPVPRHASPLSAEPLLPQTGLKRTSALFGRRKQSSEEAEAVDEDTLLLRDSLSTVNRFLAGETATASRSEVRARHDNVRLQSTFRQVSSISSSSRVDNTTADDDNLFSTAPLRAPHRTPHRVTPHKSAPPKNKVMTPAEFEKYRKDKEREKSDDHSIQKDNDNEEEVDNYEDEEDEIEKSKQAARQRRKQEAHMTVYRQQMMKVTGESGSGDYPRAGISGSFSTPNLLSPIPPSRSPAGVSDPSDDDDEEVPLAILAAHGFPSKNRPPTRLSTMMSNPNLHAAAAQSYQRPSSAVGDAPSGGGRLPAFARNLPQDPFLGAGLVNSAPRESFSFGAGAPAPRPTNGPLAPGGLVGVIANEERSRALRRGSPALDTRKAMPPADGINQVDPISGIPHQMMYPSMAMGNGPALSPGDQAQIQMTQQMQQFMQMQMQFMQMMSASNGNNIQRPATQMGYPSSADFDGYGMGMGMGSQMGTSDLGQQQYLDNASAIDPSRHSHTRTMSMVQPSSGSWVQQPYNPGGPPSIRIQGANGYAPSIAPSERSNVGLPGRYRPVSHVPPASSIEPLKKSSTMSGALSGWDQPKRHTTRSPLHSSGNVSDEDDDEGWEAMKAKREKKKSTWKTKKTLGDDLAALIH